MAEGYWNRLFSSKRLSGYKRHFLTLLLVVLVFALGVVAKLYYDNFTAMASDPHPPHHYQPSPVFRLPQQTSSGEPTMRSVTLDCRRPLTSGDAELCAQLGAVKLGVETNRLTRLGLSLAVLSFILTSFGALISIFGTGLIWIAYKETREANDIAKDALLQEYRPIIIISDLEITRLRRLDGVRAGHGDVALMELHFKVKIKNVGRTPAIGLSSFIVIKGLRGEIVFEGQWPTGGLAVTMGPIRALSADDAEIHEGFIWLDYDKLPEERVFMLESFACYRGLTTKEHSFRSKLSWLVGSNPDAGLPNRGFTKFSDQHLTGPEIPFGFRVFQDLEIV